VVYPYNKQHIQKLSKSNFGDHQRVGVCGLWFQGIVLVEDSDEVIVIAPVSFTLILI